MSFRTALLVKVLNFPENMMRMLSQQFSLAAFGFSPSTPEGIIYLRSSNLSKCV